MIHTEIVRIQFFQCGKIELVSFSLFYSITSHSNEQNGQTVDFFYMESCDTMFLLTLRTHSLSGPTRAGAELCELVGGVVCSTVLGLRGQR